jgi:hypothetical protein
MIVCISFQTSHLQVIKEFHGWSIDICHSPKIIYSLANYKEWSKCLLKAKTCSCSHSVEIYLNM